MVQLHGRQIDRHAQFGETLIVPFAQLAAGLIQYPFPDSNNAAVLLGQRDKQIRRHHAVNGVLPTQERLDTHHLMVAVADLRLVHHVQLIAQQGVAQVFFQLAPTAHLGVDTGDVELITAARA